MDKPLKIYVYCDKFDLSLVDRSDDDFMLITVPEKYFSSITIQPGTIVYAIDNALPDIASDERLEARRLVTKHSFLRDFPRASFLDHIISIYKDVPAPFELPIVVSFDGSIAAGKSTLISILTEELRLLKYDVVPVQEPVDEWQSSGMLKLFYSDIPKYAFLFQMFVLHSRYRAFRSVWDPKRKAVYLLERSIYTDRHVFVEMLKSIGGISESELRVYEDYWSTFQAELPSNMKFVYLDTPVDVSMTRVATRARDEEKSMKHEYQEKLKNANDKFFETLSSSHRSVLRIGDVASSDFRVDPFRIDLAKKILSWVFSDTS